MKPFQILGLAILLSFGAVAQEPVIIREVEITEPQTPVYQTDDGEETLQAAGMKQPAVNAEKWFRIAACFETRPAWLDRLTLEYYVLLPSPGGQPVLFKGTVGYSDIPAGRDHPSDMYLHFNTWKRYGKRGSISYAVIALIDGKEVSVKTNRQPDNWWKSIQPHPGGLLNRKDTPFRVFN